MNKHLSFTSFVLIYITVIIIILAIGGASAGTISGERSARMHKWLTSHDCVKVDALVINGQEHASRWRCGNPKPFYRWYETRTGWPMAVISNLKPATTPYK